MKKETLHAVADACDSAAGQIRAAANQAKPVGKIDWTNFKSFLSQMLQTLAPLLISALVAKLEPETDDANETKTE